MNYPLSRLNMNNSFPTQSKFLTLCHWLYNSMHKTECQYGLKKIAK